MCRNERKPTVLLGFYFVALTDNKFMVTVERDVHNPDFLAFAQRLYGILNFQERVNSDHFFRIWDKTLAFKRRSSAAL
jgi:hypothetical protein